MIRLKYSVRVIDILFPAGINKTWISTLYKILVVFIRRYFNVDKNQWKEDEDNIESEEFWNTLGTTNVSILIFVHSPQSSSFWRKETSEEYKWFFVFLVPFRASFTRVPTEFNLTIKQGGYKRSARSWRTDKGEERWIRFFPAPCPSQAWIDCWYTPAQTEGFLINIQSMFALRSIV